MVSLSSVYFFAGAEDLVYVTAVYPTMTFTLKMTTAAFAEMLEGLNKQHSSDAKA